MAWLVTTGEPSMSAVIEVIQAFFLRVDVDWAGDRATDVVDLEEEDDVWWTRSPLWIASL
jgi:hypothetical protein